jgi:hypothetical protein
LPLTPHVQIDVPEKKGKPKVTLVSSMAKAIAKVKAVTAKLGLKHPAPGGAGKPASGKSGKSASGKSGKSSGSKASKKKSKASKAAKALASKAAQKRR